jgi:type II secretory pathway pseudopilin PulG
MNYIYSNTRQSGQTLITLLFFMVISLVIIGTAVIVLMLNSQGTTKLEEGIEALAAAEGGAENAVLRLLRNPNYTGEILPIGGGTATITVTGTDPKTITSTAQIGNHIKRVQVVVGYTNNILTVSSWREVN